jgi:hypothetical protein
MVWGKSVDLKKLEARVGIEPTRKGFADRSAARLNPLYSGSDSSAWHFVRFLSAWPAICAEGVPHMSEAPGLARSVNSPLEKMGRLERGPWSLPAVSSLTPEGVLYLRV